MNIENFDDKSIEIWHRRLSHFYQRNSSKYLDQHDIIVPPCVDRKVSKMRGSNKGEIPKVKELLEIIYLNISGPYSLSINNKK